MDIKEMYEEAIENSGKYIGKDGKIYYILRQEVVDYFADIEETINACKTVLILNDAKLLTPSQRSFCFYMARIKSYIPLRVINSIRNRPPWWDDREKPQ